MKITLSEIKNLVKQIIKEEEGIDIYDSVMYLVRKNNGKFKSEKQARFLKKMMYDNEGLIGHADSGWNTAAVFATWDDEGILTLTKHRKLKTGLKKEKMWEREADTVIKNKRRYELPIFIKNNMEAIEDQNEYISEYTIKLNELQNQYDELMEWLNNNQSINDYVKSTIVKNLDDLSLKIESIKESIEEHKGYLVKFEKNLEKLKKEFETL